MDNRINNDSNSTKSVRDDDKRLNPFKDVIRTACSEEEVINILRMLYDTSINDKNIRAAKIYLEYTLGKPKEVIDLTVISEKPIFNGINLDVLTDDSTE